MEVVANSIINNLIEERAEAFVSAFSQRARALFRDDTKTNNIRHPGELGVYRENVTAELLKCFLPQHLAIETGFVVNCSGGVSKQIDLVVYNPQLTPPLESKQRQRFFPVETVVAVGEVRSDVKREPLTDALRRLAEVKALRTALNPEASAVIRWDGLGETEYNPGMFAFDQVFTFLVCKKFDFDLRSTFPSVLDEIYGDIEYGQRHNGILSVEDGLLQYTGKLQTGDHVGTYFPTSPVDSAIRHSNRWIENNGARYAALKLFCSNIFMHACHCTVGYPDMGQYHLIESPTIVEEGEQRTEMSRPKCLPER